MAERIVSPGVFTIEKDQSFLQRGVSEIGASIVGSTLKGPAQVPTKIGSFSEFQEIFGGYTDESYVPFTVQEYLKNAGTITVTRLLYENGYNLQNGVLAIVAESGSVSEVTHLLHPTQPVSTTGDSNVFEESLFENLNSGSFKLKVSGAFATDSSIPGYSAYLTTDFISASLDSTSNSYITKIFGNNPKSVNYPVYVQYENKNAFSLFNQSSEISMSLAIVDKYQFLQDFQAASTPYITSQQITGGSSIDLFKFHTLSHGNVENFDVKVGVRDIKVSSEVSDPNGYGTFTLEVRRVNNQHLPTSPFDSDDTDKSPDIVEQFTNLNLDPDSPNYIVRRIGDQFRTIDSDGKIYDNGDYPNLSKYIRIEVTENVKAKAIDASLIPFGFRATNSPIPDVSGSAGNLNLGAVSYISSQVIGSSYSSKNYFGFDYTNLNNLNYLAPLPTSGSNTGSNTDFYLGNVSQAAEANFPSIAGAYSGSIGTSLDAGRLATEISINTRKFMVPFQGGFDGSKPNLPKMIGTNIKSSNTLGFDCSTSTSTGTLAYRKAFAALSNTDFFDMNMLITPGLIDRLHSSVTAEARQLAEDRQDTFYIMDAGAVTDSISTVVNQVNSID